MELEMSYEEKLFKSIGFDKIRVRDTLKSKPLTDLLIAIIRSAGVEKGCDKSIGHRLYDLATKSSKISIAQATFIAPYIGQERIKTPQQVQAAIEFVVRQSADVVVDLIAFERYCGVGRKFEDGVFVSPQEIRVAVGEVLALKRVDLSQKRWQLKGYLIGLLTKDKLKWAESIEVASEVHRQLELLFGPEPLASSWSSTTTPDPSVVPTLIDTKDVHRREGEQGVTIRLQDPCTPFKSIKLREALQHEGQRCKVQAWCYRIRAHHSRVFVDLRDGTGFIQAVLEGSIAKYFLEKSISREASVTVWGTLIRPPSKHAVGWSGLELHVDYFELIGASSVDLEGLISEDSLPDLLFDQRHIMLRREHDSQCMLIRSYTMRAMRDHFFSQFYHEVTPPTLVGALCEGGSEVFKVDYFGQTAYLTQSSQLYLETCIPVLGDVFCIMPSYRAEKFRTRRHLTEYTHLEVERPFITFDDLLDSIEAMVCDTYERIMRYCGPQLLALHPQAAVPKRPFKRLDYADAIEFCRKHLIYKDESTKQFFEFGDDIPEKPERRMIEIIGEPTFLCRFPAEMKPFYMKKDPKDLRLTESCDLLVPGIGEIVGGSMRIHDYAELLAAYEREGLDPSAYYWFTDQRKYGSVPHGGYGLGVERFLVWVLGEEHIRSACLYPRFTRRCSP